MADVMSFPETWEEFEKMYGFTDDKEEYTNGSRLIQSFRVEQWLEHIRSIEDCKEPERKKGKWIGKPIAGYSKVRCSVCNDVFLDNAGRWKYCPHCGAETEESNDNSYESF